MYADHTALWAVSVGDAQRHLDATVEAGRAYSLELSFGKKVMLTVRGDVDVIEANGHFFENQQKSFILMGS